MATRRPKRKNAGPRSVRKSKKALKKHAPYLYRQFRSVKKNAPKVKGRKVKGGRAVTLKNFTGSVIRKANGQVVIKGKGRK